MTYAELHSSLQSMGGVSGIDVLGYDACVAAQIEVLFTWRPHATHFGGELVARYEFDYHGTIPYQLQAKKT